MSVVSLHALSLERNELEICTVIVTVFKAAGFNPLWDNNAARHCNVTSCENENHCKYGKYFNWHTKT